MTWYKSKTIWAAVIIGAVHAAGAIGVIPNEVVSTIEGIAIAVFGIGARQAIAKNGAGK